MQFKVPQDVQQADRIVGPLTFIQLIICIVGGGFAYATFSILANQGLPAPLWAIPVGIILLLTAAFAFVRINNLPFHKLLALLVERTFIPSKRVWVKGADRVTEPDLPEKDKKKEENSREKEDNKEQQMENIESITTLLDKKEDKAQEILEKIDKAEDKELVQEAFDAKVKQDKKDANTHSDKQEKTQEKILELSKNPTKETQNNEPKKKKHRRRRRRRKPMENHLKTQGNTPEQQIAPKISKPETKSSDTSKQNNQQQDNQTPDTSKPDNQQPAPQPVREPEALPNWLQEGTQENDKKETMNNKEQKNEELPTPDTKLQTPKKKRRRRRNRKPRPQTDQNQAKKTPEVNLESTPQASEKPLTPVPSKPEVKQTEEPKKPDTREPENQQRDNQTPDPPLAGDTSQPANQTPEALPNWLQEGTQENDEKETINNEEQIIEEPTNNDQPSTINQKPSTNNKKAKVSEEFSADDLKKGQEISFD